MSWLLYLFAAAAGALNTVQAGANAQLRKSLDQPLAAALSVYLTGLVCLLPALPFGAIRGLAWSKAGQVPWWAWFGGVLSIASTMAGLLLAQRLGSGAFTALTVTFGLISSVILDHFGLIGFEVHRASPLRLAGCALLLAGLFLITKF